MLEKLHSMGIIEKSREQGGALSQVERLTVSAICRRRLPIVMVREQKMIQYVDKVSLLPLSYSKLPMCPILVVSQSLSICNVRTKWMVLHGYWLTR
jgi:hypothetical protein